MAQSSTTKSSGATSMADLMAKYNPTFTTFKKGDTVKGTITKLEKNEILMDIQAKGAALVIEKDQRLMRNLLAAVKVGDVVEATVISAESESGQPIVSLRRFLDGKTWTRVEDLKKSQEKLPATITEMTKGGFVLVSDNGLSGFLPNSHVSSGVAKEFAVGKKTIVTIADYDKDDNKVIFSQKATQSPEEFEKVVNSLKAGDKVKATIVHPTTFGYFVTVPLAESTVDGLIHISEISWERVEDAQGMFKVGQEVEAVILGVDKDARRMDLSIKKLTKDPFTALKEEFPVDKKVTGTVREISDGNVSVSLSNGVEGFIKKEKVPPTVRYEVGSTVTATVSSHDQRRRRIELVPVLLEKPIGYR